MSKKHKSYENEDFKEDLAEFNYNKKYNKYEARDSKRSKHRTHSSDYFYD